MKKRDLNKKESWREEIIWLRSPFVTCQYLEGFQAILNHEWENSRATNLARNVLISTFFRGSKSFKNRYRFCTIWLVGLEKEIIDKDFRQSYWLALQFWVQPNGFLPWECHRHPTEEYIANGTSKNVGLGKYWQDLEISEAFLISLEVSFFHGLFLLFSVSKIFTKGSRARISN